MRSSLARTPVAGAAQQINALTAGGTQGLDLVIEMAHDLRSPLSSILMLAEYLKSGQSGPITAAQRRQLGLIHSAALSLCAVASDVIELAREGGHLTDHLPQPFSVTETFDAVRQMVLPIAVEKNVDYRVLAPVTDGRTGWERGISRVLLNLSTNALKFTDKGFVEVSARDVNDDPALVEFVVRDSGRGIEPSEMRTLFEPFKERESQRGHQFSSSGLGLTICQKLLTAMGSALRIQTIPGSGTRFSFVLALPPSKRYRQLAVKDVTASPQS